MPPYFLHTIFGAPAKEFHFNTLLTNLPRRYLYLTFFQAKSHIVLTTEISLIEYFGVANRRYWLPLFGNKVLFRSPIDTIGYRYLVTGAVSVANRRYWLPLFDNKVQFRSPIDAIGYRY